MTGATIHHGDGEGSTRGGDGSDGCDEGNGGDGAATAIAHGCA